MNNLILIIILLSLIYIDAIDINNNRHSNSNIDSDKNRNNRYNNRKLAENEYTTITHTLNSFEPTEEPGEPTNSPTFIVYKTKSPNVYRTRSPSYEPTIATPTSYPLLFKPDGEEPVTTDTDGDEPSVDSERTRTPTEPTDTDVTEPLAIGVVLGVSVIAIGVALFIMLSANDKSSTAENTSQEENTTANEAAPLLE
jgi:uncharacterized membrane protein